LGNADASLAIGVMHEKGQGRQPSIEEAIKWYRLAADQGSAAAKYLLGKFYMEGEVVGQDLKFAAQCFYEAASDDHVDAMVDFGHLAETLQGNAEETAENVKKAVFWYKKAVSHKSPRGQVLLGSCYFRGIGVEQDYLEAVSLFRKAADQVSL
jgi:TPR repeat protein